MRSHAVASVVQSSGGPNRRYSWRRIYGRFGAGSTAHADRVTAASVRRLRSFSERLPVHAAGPENDYRHNILVRPRRHERRFSLAVIKWKKMADVYADLEQEHFSAHATSMNAIVNVSASESGCRLHSGSREVTELTGVPRGERDPANRLTSRNGYRDRRWDTRVGTMNLAIPRVRDGSYFPSLLEPRRRADRALLAVVQEAYVLGVSTRRVEDLVDALGIASLSRSEVSRICAALDAEVEAFRSRSLADETYPYLWLDATYVKVREAGRVVSMAALVATGVAASGERRILGLELAPGNDEGSAWPAFIRALIERGLSGVRLVISDDHRGLVKAVREQLLGAAWQRSSVHSEAGPDRSPSRTRAESALAAAIG